MFWWEIVSLGELGKGGHSDIPKVRYLRYEKTIDRELPRPDMQAFPKLVRVSRWPLFIHKV